MESAAFPRFSKILALLMIAVIALAAARASDTLRNTDWSWTSLGLIAGAWICIAWLGYWIVNSRTRLEGDTLVQTWIWTKRSRVQDVAHLKLVHWPWVDGLVAPRLLVRQRSGGVMWFNAADATLLREFCTRVAVHRSGGAPKA